MEKHEHSMNCPVCGDRISSESEQDLIQKVRQHGKEKHNREMSEQQVRDMMQQQQMQR